MTLRVCLPRISFALSIKADSGRYLPVHTCPKKGYALSTASSLSGSAARFGGSNSTASLFFSTGSTASSLCFSRFRIQCATPMTLSLSSWFVATTKCWSGAPSSAQNRLSQ